MKQEHQGQKTFAAFVKDERLSLLIVATSVLVFLFLEFHGWFASLEGHAFDLWIGSLSKKERKNSERQIHVVEIDDDAYDQCFQRHSPLEAKTIESWVQYLAQEHVVVVDLITDDLGYQGFQPSRNVVWAVPDQTRYRDAQGFMAWLKGENERSVVLGSVLGGSFKELGKTDKGTDTWGVPAFPLEDDGRVRRMPRYFSSDALVTGSLAVRAAQAAGNAAHPAGSAWDEVFLDARLSQPHVVKALEIFPHDVSTGCALSASPGVLEARRILPKDIVVLGGTYGEARDSVVTPLGKMSGVEVNALAIEAEFAGNQLREPPKLWMVLLDLMIGFGMVRIFWRRDYSVQRFFIVSVVAVVLGYGVASAYFYNYVGWVSWVGPLLGAVTGFVIDLVRKNPMLVHEKPAPVTRTEINVTVVSSSATFLGATRDGAEDDLGR